MFNKYYNGPAHFYVFHLDTPKNLDLPHWLYALSKRIRGTLAKVKLYGVTPIGYRINVLGHTTAVTIWVDRKIDKKELSFGLIEDAFGALTSIASGISDGIANITGAADIIPKAQSGPDVGTIAIGAGVIVVGALLAALVGKIKNLEKHIQ